MSRFAQFWCQTWHDQHFTELSTDARLLFIWSWTNPNATICGLYRCSAREMQRALGDVSKERVAFALRELAQKPMVLYDEENEVIWVVNRAKHSNRSPKVARAMQREVQACPPSQLVEGFVNRYGEMLDLRLKGDE